MRFFSRKAGARPPPKRLVALALAAPLIAALAFIACPLDDALLDPSRSSSIQVLDRTGGVLYQTLSPEGQRSVPLAEGLPPNLRAALVAAEDRRFFEHPGVDVRAMLRALKDSINAGKIVSGASTIPQQLARRLVPRDRSIAGKIKEALWALRLSAHLDKERILVEYANRLPLGHGAVGVEAASETYFGRPARTLSVAESALLAGLAHAPAREDPLRFPERALARRNVILARMHTEGSIDDVELAQAKAEPLDLAPQRRRMKAPHFVSRVLHGREASPRETWTTIDSALQEEVEQIIQEELEGPLAARGVGQAAVIVVDNATGEILAYAGSRDYFDDDKLGRNDGVRSLRQPGSALKPFVYGLALAKGMTPATLLPDVETTLATETGSYVPRNYDKRVHGPVRLRAALQNSYNIPAVHVASVLTPRHVLEGLRAAGFSSLTEDPEHYGVGVVLGNGDVTLYEMARAYRGLANRGVVSALLETRDAVPTERPRRFLPANVVALLTHIMADETARSPAFGVDNALRFPFPVAAKTGTSRAYVDNWTAGFTRERTVAVWAGNFDGSPMKQISGVTGAGTIFRRAMMAAMRGVAPAPLVDTSRFTSARICPLSGKRASRSCAGAFEELFLPGTEPGDSCDVHTLVNGDRALALAPRYQSWARNEGHKLAHVDGPLRLLSPMNGDEFVLEPGVPSGQGVPVRVAAAGHDVVEVRSGDKVLTLRAPFTAWLDDAPGVHVVELRLPGAANAVDVAQYVVR